MPRKYRKRPLNKRLKRYNNLRYKKGFTKPRGTNKQYHPKIPRTLQIATRRNNSQMLRFVKNMTYEINNQSLTENIFLTVRANSIYHILANNGSQNQPGTWLAQSSVYNATSGLVVNADGYNEWNERFNHFTVLGSKIQVTYQPIQAAHDATGKALTAPTTLYITLAGHAGQIGPSTPMSAIAGLPYQKRAQIMGSNTDASGARLWSFYSAKKFEGVKDVMDNAKLKGTFSNSLTSPHQPVEQSFFNVGLVPTAQQSLGISSPPKIPAGIFRVKVEYIVKLTEPTNTNQVSA